jgi:hypothetical protein
MTMKSSDEVAQWAAEKFVEWLRLCVIQDATGEKIDVTETQPYGTFWLGRLASEEAVFAGEVEARGDRLDPCSIGLRFLPDGNSPWILSARVCLRSWMRDQDRARWRKSPLVDQEVTVRLDSADLEASFGEEQLRTALKGATGIDCLAARIDVSCTTTDDGRPELTVTLVNSSPSESEELGDTHLYECSLQLSGCPTQPYLLEALPDSFRYDRRVPAYGINCGVVQDQAGTLSTRDDPTTDRFRPEFWPVGMEEPKFTFDALAQDPVPLARQLLNALRQWGDANWGNARLEQRRLNDNWSSEMFEKATCAAAAFWEEWRRIEAGIRVISDAPELATAFRNMNAAMAISARGKYNAWRPFQFGFLLANLEDLISEDGGREIADVVWFATGGGKTETYLIFDCASARKHVPSA